MGTLLLCITLLPFVLLARALSRKSLPFLKDASAFDALGLAGGLGYLALLMFGLGIFRAYSPKVLWTVVGIHYGLAFLVCGLNWPFRMARRAVRLFRSWKEETTLGKILLGVGSVFLLFNVLGSYIPQTGDDALYYHFALPKLFIQHGGLFFYPYNLTSVRPFNIEMLFTFGMLLHNQIASNLLNVVIGLSFMLMIYNLIKEYLGRAQALFWSVVFYSTPFTLAQAHKGFVDFGVGLFATAGIYLLLLAIRKKKLNVKAAVFSGVFFGLAAGSKSMGAMAGLFASFALFCCFFRQYGRRIVLYSGLIVLLTGLVASPWYVRSTVHTGNPVYPALYSVFGGKYFNEALDRRLKGVMNSTDINMAPLGRSLAGFVAAPFFLHYPRIVGKWFAREDGEGRSFSAARTHLSYLSLIFLPFGFLYAFRKKALIKESSFMAVTAGLFFYVWFFYLPQDDRHLSPILGIVYLFSAFGLKSIFEDGRSRWLRRVSIGACALWLFAALGMYVIYYSPKAHGAIRREDYLDQYSHLHKTIRWVNSHLGPDKKIAILSDMPLYYLDVSYIHIGPAFRLFDYKDGPSLYEFLIGQKVTHIFVALDLNGNYLYTQADQATNSDIYFFRSDAPSYQSELSRRSAHPIEDLLSKPLKSKVVYDDVETPVIARTPIILGSPIRLKVYELK